jgi:hypothetical protein
LVGHCASLYEQNSKAISALETHLQSYGYAEKYFPLPPSNPLDLLNGSDPTAAHLAKSHPKSAVKPGALGMLSPAYSDVSDILRDTSLSPTIQMDQHMIPPPSTVQRRLGGPAAHLTAAQALAPMTAAKARTLRQDTPSSVSSIEDLTPSMRHLLGKYATTSGSEGLGGGRLSSFSFLSPAGSRPNSRRGTILTLPSPSSLSPAPLSPMPLSPAFAAAAEHQRAQIEQATAATLKVDVTNHDDEEEEKFEENQGVTATEGGLGSPIPFNSPPVSLVGAAAADGLNINNINNTNNTAAIDNDSPLEIMQLEAADAFLASTAQKLANNPALLDSYRDKYPHIVASTEKYFMSASPVAGPQSGYYDEESTMELKAQVIYNRALSGQHLPYTGYQSMAIPSATTAVTPAATMYAAEDARTAQASAQALANQKSRESLEEAIAAALARPSITRNPATSTTTTTTSSGGSGGGNGRITSSGTATTGKTTTAHVTPAATAGPMSGAPSAGGGIRTLPSARGSLPSSLTPSLPTSVAPWIPIDGSEYSSLPGFVKGQMPLDVLNEAAASMHAFVVRRCAAGDGASFTMDDIEEVGTLPVGKGKAFINALAKLGRVQLKVVFGQGTVYFFVV